ncbi:Cell surface protein [Oopsacas minuta]|uniref:Cell surface protein n=1 Tax=Oopsacas minuta TaxID=111878 RepID=A0AAV7JFE9_9METZ|nr:Cell surface protein [Oopsacas minuta]
MANVDQEDNFLSQLVRVRREIQDKVTRTHKELQEKEADLLAELERLEDEYTGGGISKQITNLAITKDNLVSALRGNEENETLKACTSPIDARIIELENKIKKSNYLYKTVELEWDVKFEIKLSITDNTQLNPEKHTQTQPIITFGNHRIAGYSPSAFCYPQGIAINPTTKCIYIGDEGNNRVQVFDESFVFLSEFSEKMDQPAGICVKQNVVYVIQHSSNRLNVYSTEGKLIQSIGGRGKKKMKFDKPKGLAVSPTMDMIYIADFDNNRVQCLNLNLTFNSCIDNIYGARDIVLTSGEIVVLSCRNPCVAFYSYSHQLIREIIPWGKGTSVTLPHFFILDRSFNILISDYRSHCICVFSNGGDFIHGIGREGREMGEFIKPRGIALDFEGRIIVVSQNPNHCIQIFLYQN